jgi:hypothetical protein
MWTPTCSEQESKRANVTASRDVRSMAEHPAFNRRDEGSNPLRPTDRQQARGVAAAHPALNR